MFGFLSKRGDVFTKFMSEEVAVAMAESGFLIWYISKYDEPDSFTKSFD